MSKERIAKDGEQKDSPSVFLLEDEGNKSVVSSVQNVPFGTGKPGDFPLVVRPLGVPLSACLPSCLHCTV